MQAFEHNCQFYMGTLEKISACCPTVNPLGKSWGKQSHVTLTLNGAGKGHTFFSETLWTKMELETVRLWNHLYVQFLLEPIVTYGNYLVVSSLYSGLRINNNHLVQRYQRYNSELRSQFRKIGQCVGMVFIDRILGRENSEENINHTNQNILKLIQLFPTHTYMPDDTYTLFQNTDIHASLIKYN